MPRLPLRCWTALLLGLVAIPAVRAAVHEAVVELPSANDARLPVLFTDDDAHPPTAAAVLFTGGDGVLNLRRRIPAPGSNFLVRSRSLFVARGVATAVIDAPTDRNFLNDPYRMGARHADDVRAVVVELKRRHPGVPVFLVGTSRGTISAAYTGTVLRDEIAGVVLSSSLFNSGKAGPGLAGFDWDGLRAPLLFVHHEADACPLTPYGAAVRAASGHVLVTAHGGEPPRSDACDAFSAHGYLGVEEPVVQAIVTWLTGGTPPRDVP